jgi:UDP-glucose 4-epimerase
MVDLRTPAVPGSQRFLITGGAGFIGSHLAETLLAQGHAVTVLDDLSTGQARNISHLLSDPLFHFVNGSIADVGVMQSLVADCDAIFHLAAAVGVSLIVDEPLRGIETNVLGTHTLLKVAQQFGRKVLVASTSEVYGKSSQPRFHEDDDQILGPTSKARWSYANAKTLDEFLALAHHRRTGLPVVIFRLFNTIGPRQTGRYGMVVPRFMEQALRGERLTVYGDGHQSRCFCDVEDVVRALIGLAASPQAIGLVVNIGSTHEVTILELARNVLAVVDADNANHPGDGESFEDRIRFVGYEQAYGAGFEDMRRRCPDTDRIKTLIGWEPNIPLEETLRRVCASLDRELKMRLSTRNAR